MISIVGGIGNVRGALVTSLGAGILTAAVTLVTNPIYGHILLLIGFIFILNFRKERRLAILYLQVMECIRFLLSSNQSF